MNKCKSCGRVPECGTTECEICKKEGCDWCVPETDCGHSICFSCLENLEEQSRKKLTDRITELELSHGVLTAENRKLRELKQLRLAIGAVKKVSFEMMVPNMSELFSEEILEKWSDYCGMIDKEMKDRGYDKLISGDED